MVKFNLKVIVVLVIIVEIILVYLAYIYSIFFLTIASFLASNTALIVPFLLNALENKKIKKEKEDIFLGVIKRIKKYLCYFLQPENQSDRPALDNLISYFIAIQKKYPEILMKLGIEANRTRTENYSNIISSKIIESSTIFVADRYIFFIEVNKVKIYDRTIDKEMEKKSESCKQILKTIKKYAEENYSLELNDEWFKFSNCQKK